MNEWRRQTNAYSAKNHKAQIADGNSDSRREISERPALRRAGSPTSRASPVDQKLSLGNSPSNVLLTNRIHVQ